MNVRDLEVLKKLSNGKDEIATKTVPVLVKGERGLPGAKGEKGETGATGLKGEAGAAGLPGQDGSDGKAGIDGKPGPHGLTGAKGNDGEKGEDGAKGESGKRGTPGARGATGSGGSGSAGLMDVERFNDSTYVYFLGDTTAGWQCNRWSLSSVRTIATGTSGKPTDLAGVQALSYS